MHAEIGLAAGAGQSLRQLVEQDLLHDVVGQRLRAAAPSCVPSTRPTTS